LDNKSTNQKQKNRRKIAFVISIIVFVALIAGCAVYLAVCTPFFDGLFGGNGATETGIAPSTSEVIATSAPDDTGAVLPDNPIDFAAQFNLNPDIYAWITIPNTNIDYPILQSSVDDLYYLRRGIDQNYNIAGVLFTQSHNRRDFTDPVTVIYGHNMTGYGDTMFAHLHYFENADFFRDNQYFYIYTPGHILTYYIVSAYKYDDRHIMNSFDFSDPEVRRKFFDSVLNPTMVPMNVREGVEIKDDDKLVILSTCMSTSAYRYLVCGVLMNDELTN